MGVTFDYVRGQWTLEAIDLFFDSVRPSGESEASDYDLVETVELNEQTARNRRIIFGLIEAIAPQGAPDPAEHDDSYRTGYDAGWHASRRGHPSNPAHQEQGYVQGYQHGYQMAQHAGQVSADPASESAQKAGSAIWNHYNDHLERATARGAARAIRGMAQHTTTHQRSTPTEAARSNIADWATRAVQRRKTAGGAEGGTTTGLASVVSHFVNTSDKWDPSKPGDKQAAGATAPSEFRNYLAGSVLKHAKKFAMKEGGRAEILSPFAGQGRREHDVRREKEAAGEYARGKGGRRVALSPAEPGSEKTDPEADWELGQGVVPKGKMIPFSQMAAKGTDEPSEFAGSVTTPLRAHSLSTERGAGAGEGGEGDAYAELTKHMHDVLDQVAPNTGEDLSTVTGYHKRAFLNHLASADNPFAHGAATGALRKLGFDENNTKEWKAAKVWGHRRLKEFKSALLAHPVIGKHVAAMQQEKEPEAQAEPAAEPQSASGTNGAPQPEKKKRGRPKKNVSGEAKPTTEDLIGLAMSAIKTVDELGLFTEEQLDRVAEDIALGYLVKRVLGN